MPERIPHCTCSTQLIDIIAAAAAGRIGQWQCGITLIRFCGIAPPVWLLLLQGGMCISGAAACREFWQRGGSAEAVGDLQEKG